MQVRDKLIKEVAQELGISQKKVREVIMAQSRFIRKIMKSKKEVSIYLRKVGLFMHSNVRETLKQERIERTKNKVKTTKVSDEDPLEFE